MDFGPREFPVLETPRLLLRELRQEDLPSFSKIFMDPKVCAHYGFAPQSSEEVLGWFESFKSRFANQKGIRWAIILKSTSEYIGNFGFHRLRPEQKLLERGLQIATPYWGQGYGTEASQAAMNWLIKTTPYRNVEAWISESNSGALTLVKKQGFVVSGETKIEHGQTVVRVLLTLNESP